MPDASTVAQFVERLNEAGVPMVISSRVDYLVADTLLQTFTSGLIGASTEADSSLVIPPGSLYILRGLTVRRLSGDRVFDYARIGKDGTGGWLDMVSGLQTSVATFTTRAFGSLFIPMRAGDQIIIGTAAGGATDSTFAVRPLVSVIRLGETG